jgi:hypothetical protein
VDSSAGLLKGSLAGTSLGKSWRGNYEEGSRIALFLLFKENVMHTSPTPGDSSKGFKSLPV